MHLTTETFRECASRALEELDADSEPTEIRRTEAWIEKLVRNIHRVKSDFAGEALGERDPEEDPNTHYADVTEYLAGDAEDE
jgi:hypothetical protein